MNCLHVVRVRSMHSELGCIRDALGVGLRSGRKCVHEVCPVNREVYYVWPCVEYSRCPINVCAVTCVCKEGLAAFLSLLSS